MPSEAICDVDVKVKDHEGSTQVGHVQLNLALEQEEQIIPIAETKSWSPEEPIL